MKAALTSMLLCFCAQGHLPATLSPWQDCMTSRSGLCRQPAQGGRASTTPTPSCMGLALMWKLTRRTRTARALRRARSSRTSLSRYVHLSRLHVMLLHGVLPAFTVTCIAGDSSCNGRDTGGFVPASPQLLGSSGSFCPACPALQLVSLCLRASWQQPVSMSLRQICAS